ncbi:MAG: chromosome partitioning protein [Deltaproteobacteria bacterium]|nr:MAG: chromosome partitioning protein [Deltaproteobacteria bacterium]
MLGDLLHRRLVFVTGKGGVGKTAVTLALAAAATRARRRVLVVEVNPHGRVGEYLGGVTLGPEPVEVAPGLSVAAIEPTVILEEFALRILRIRALARRLLQSQTFRIVAAAAPGIDDFLTLVRIAGWEDARTGLQRRRHRFDLVLVDAPATGHSVPLLATPGSLLKMLPFGPLAGTARELALLLSDPERTAVAVVTRAEEMAVNETLELSSAIMRVGVPLLPTIVNAVAPLRFSRAELRRLLKEPPDVPASLRPHAAAGAFSAARQRAAEREIRRLGRALATSPVALPLLATQRFTPAAIDELADAIERVGTRRRARAVA